MGGSESSRTAIGVPLRGPSEIPTMTPSCRIQPSMPTGPKAMNASPSGSPRTRPPSAIVSSPARGPLDCTRPRRITIRSAPAAPVGITWRSRSTRVPPGRSTSPSRTRLAMRADSRTRSRRTSSMAITNRSSELDPSTACQGPGIQLPGMSSAKEVETGVPMATIEVKMATRLRCMGVVSSNGETGARDHDGVSRLGNARTDSIESIPLPETSLGNSEPGGRRGRRGRGRPTPTSGYPVRGQPSIASRLIRRMPVSRVPSLKSYFGECSPGIGMPSTACWPSTKRHAGTCFP